MKSSMNRGMILKGGSNILNEIKAKQNKRNEQE
jgi:hypothetical protein